MKNLPLSLIVCLLPAVAAAETVAESLEAASANTTV